MPTCCLCDAPADRVFASRLPMCLQDYSDARVGVLDDDKAKKLEALWNAPDPPTVPEPVTPAPKSRRAEAGEAARVGESGTDG